MSGTPNSNSLGGGGGGGCKGSQNLIGGGGGVGQSFVFICVKMRPCFSGYSSEKLVCLPDKRQRIQAA